MAQNRQVRRIHSSGWMSPTGPWSRILQPIPEAVTDEQRDHERERGGWRLSAHPTLGVCWRRTKTQVTKVPWALSCLRRTTSREVCAVLAATSHRPVSRIDLPTSI